MRRAALLALVLLASCSKKEETKGVTSSSSSGTSAASSDSGGNAPAAGSEDDPVVAPSQPAPEAEPGASRPGLSLSANDSTRPVLFKGWPLVIRVHADAGVEAAKTVLEVADAAGARAAWPLSAARGAWTLSGQESEKLAPGSYRIRANAGDASDEIVLELKEAPAAPTPAQVRERFLREVQSLLSSGKADAALDLARKQRAATPADPNPTILEGDALQALGKQGEAAAAYRQALLQFRKANPRVHEAPAFLLHRLAGVQDPGTEK